MIINTNTINVINELLNDPKVADISKYLYQNMISFVKYNNDFFKEYYDADCNIHVLKHISMKLKYFDEVIKTLTTNLSFIKLDYSVSKIVYIFSIIEIYLNENIPTLYYKIFKSNEICLENIDFDNLTIEELDSLFEQIYLKYYLVKKVYEENNTEGLIRLELINRKLKKIDNKNLFDLYLNDILDINYILTITSNDADINKYKSEFIANFIIKK